MTYVRHPRMGFGHAAELGLPVAVEDHPVDVAAVRVRLPTACLGGGEVHVGCRTHGVVGVQHRLDGPATAHLGAGDGGGDAFARHVGQFLVHELGWVGVALADKTAVKPLPGQAFELSEKMELGLFARITPLRGEQSLCQVKKQRRWPHVSGMNQVEIDGLANDALVPCDGGSHEGGRQLQHGVFVEVGGQPLLGQLHAVPRDARKADFQRISFGPLGLDLDRFSRRLGRDHHGLRGKVERYAQHVRVFDVEEVVVIEIV